MLTGAGQAVKASACIASGSDLRHNEVVINAFAKNPLDVKRYQRKWHSRHENEGLLQFGSVRFRSVRN